MNYIPDPIELGEMRAERYADENMHGNEIRCCACKKMVPIDTVLPASPDPYSPPICLGCVGEQMADESFKKIVQELKVSAVKTKTPS
jgi:hypothetical protein